MRTLFRYLLEQREWRDLDAFLPHFRRAARALADEEEQPQLATLEPARATFEAWYYGTRRPQRDARRVLVRLLGYPIEELWSQINDGAKPMPFPPSSALPDQASARRGTDTYEMRRTGAMAARRAIDFALGAERDQVGDETLGFLEDEAKRLVEEYPRVPLSEIWDDLAQAQEETFRLLESGRTKPSQQRDLLFMATVLSFLMAKGSHDMGDPKVAMSQARAAGFCAKQAEHSGLVAAVDGLKSLIAYWAGRPEDALHYARQGANGGGHLQGTVAVWLAGLEARAAGALGDTNTVRSANQRAVTLREQVVPDDLDALGGLLTFPEPKQAYYSVEAEILLGHCHGGLPVQAEQAVHGFSDRDREDPAWAFGDLAGAQCNLALAHLHTGELDGAAEAVRPVLGLPPAQRNNGIVLSAERVRTALTHGPVRDARVARDLREEITMYRPNRPTLAR